jgi:hypothetical protein
VTHAIRTATERAVEAACGWRVLLPPGWVTLPTEPEAARATIGRLLDRALAGKPRDELIHMRVELDRSLRRQAEEAARAGARFVHALCEPIRGLPVSASMIAVPVATGDPDELAGVLTAVLGGDPSVVDNDLVELGDDLPALRRVRRERVTLGEGAAATEHTATHVDFVVPVAGDAVLIMAFSTTTEPIHQELIALFDAIATTLHRWNQGA